MDTCLVPPEKFEQGRPLIEAIKKAQPDTRILLTFFSPSGYEVRKDYSGRSYLLPSVQTCPGNVRRFLDLTKPTKAHILLNMNFGRTTSTNLNAGIYPRILSRLSSAQTNILPFLWRIFSSHLKNFTHLYIQDERSRQLLASIGIDNVRS